MSAKSAAAKAPTAARPAERDLIISRLIKAPRAAVFSAFSDPRGITHWWGPHGFATTTAKMDFKPGGTWKFVMHGPNGTDYNNLIEYREIDAPSRLVYHHADVDGPGASAFDVVVTFDETEAGTHVTLRMTVASPEARAAFVEFGAVEGGYGTLERLEHHLGRAAEAATLKSSGEAVFEVTRTFDAPRHLVWQVHSTAEHMARWWGPKGCKLTIPKLEFRPGGIFHYAMRYSTGAEMWGRFIYRDLAAPHRMVFLSAFSNPAGGITRAPFTDQWPLEMLNETTLTETDGRTTLHLTTRPFGATDGERTFFAGFFESLTQGYGGTMDQLEKYLAKLQEKSLKA
ncbi:MAG: SRPBCC family protein [Hyphomicrobium sp.]